MLKRIFTIIKKEFNSFFSSPLGIIFLGSYVFASLFCFFWVDRFFERNIVDLRPLFNWTPLLLIFLSSVLTMRSWSEEKKLGTIEILFSHPVKIIDLVLGKFFGCLLLVVIGILLTTFIPITVSFMGDLDWGPVIGAYTASIFLAAVYIALGLCVSSKTDNQIVSLILSIILGGVFYFVGSPLLIQFFKTDFIYYLSLLGTGARFESIAKGVLDFRDIYYYLSLTVFFLVLCGYELTSSSWSANNSKKHTFSYLLTLVFLANILIANVWLNNINFLRLDLTSKKEYSISKTSKNLLSKIKEPINIKGFFSARTHPQLAPMVSHIKDLLTEYANNSNQIKVEFIDPKQSPESEELANKKYGIKPIPFQVANRNEASIVNSYFDVVVSYGDKFEILGFRNLIDVRFDRNQMPEIKLKSLEYDLTKTIKKLVYEFNSTDSVVAKIAEPTVLKLYVSGNIPDKLKEYKTQLLKTYAKFQNLNTNLKIEEIDPLSGDQSTAKMLNDSYGIRPMVADLNDKNQFYFYPLVFAKNEVFALPNPDTWDEVGALKSLEVIFKRLAPGLIKTVAILTDKPEENQNTVQSAPRTFGILQQYLQQNFNVVNVNDAIPGEADLLMVLAPEKLTETQLYQMDQFLMRGGSIILSTAPFGMTRDFRGLSIAPVNSRIFEWLKFHGIEIGDAQVMDSQSQQFPAQVMTETGEKELALIQYPPLPDLRGEQINSEFLPIPQFGFAWGAELMDKTKNLKVTKLLQSSENSWLSPERQIEPDFAKSETGFTMSKEYKSYPLAMMFEGKFESYFKDKKFEDSSEGEDKKIFSAIQSSPVTSKLIVFSSNDVFSDLLFSVNSELGSNSFENALLATESLANYALQDQSLNGISRTGHFARTINPKYSARASFYEGLNYFLGFVGILIVLFITTLSSKIRQNRYRKEYGV